MSEPTIFARGSGSGRAAVAIIRVSGPATAEAITRLAGRLPAPRAASLRTLRDAQGETLDRALVLWFPAPRSFTGEDAAELQLHGGRAVVDGVLAALSAIAGLRPAEPGEFTRRAFHNGRMDLPEVEALADLIEADTAAQRRQAMRQLDGALGQWARKLRAALIEALALSEACIDFSEEEDLVTDFADELRRVVATVDRDIGTQLASAGRGEKLREGLVVIIAGPPNVGKSALLNRLAGRDVAIVSAHAGTTRDAIEVDLDLGGHVVRLVDTAGLRETSDPVEQEGIARARARAASADLVLWLDDGSGDAGDRPAGHDKAWTLATKADLARPRRAPGDLAVSAATGQGIEKLVARLSDFAAHSLAGGETALVTRLRHRQALEAAHRHLSIVRLSPGLAAELIAEELRGAMTSLESLVGTVSVEDVLGGIFARFCIGK